MFKKLIFLYLALLCTSYSYGGVPVDEDEAANTSVDINYSLISRERLDSSERMRRLLNSVSHLRVTYSQGLLYLEYINCREGGVYRYIPYVYIDEKQVLHISWKLDSIPLLYECQEDFVANYKFNIRYSGKVSISNSMNSWAYLFDNRDEVNVELETREGLDISIPIDRSQSFFPYCTNDHVWLYGYVKDSLLTGRFATMVHKHNKGSISGCEIRRSESDVFDASNSRLMGYVRNDGIRHYVTPVDDNLPYDFWVEGMQGYFNPWKITGGKEFTPYAFYPEEGFFITRDFILNNFIVFNVVGRADVLQKFVMDESKSAMAGGVVRELLLNDGVHVREDLGMYGEGCNDILYPTMAGNGTDSPQLKLICSYYQNKIGDRLMLYSNPNYYQQYIEHQSSIKRPQFMRGVEIAYTGTEVMFSCEGIASLGVYSIDGRNVKSVDGSNRLSLSVVGIPSGVYIVKGNCEGGFITKAILIK